jgi:hypothetical protein
MSQPLITVQSEALPLPDLARLLNRQHDALADRIDQPGVDRHEQALLQMVSGLLHQASMSIYNLLEYQRKAF